MQLVKSSSVNSKRGGPEAERTLPQCGNRRSVSLVSEKEGVQDRARQVGRCQIMGGVTGLGEEFGFYFTCSENIWKF